MFHPRKLLTIGLALLLLAACAPGPAPTSAPLPTVTLAATNTAIVPTATVGVVPDVRRAPEEEGRLRVIQAAPDSGSVDVYLEQALVAGRLGPGAFTNPIQVAAGSYNLQVVPVGALPSTQVLASGPITIEAEQSYLVLVTGASDSLSVAVFQEDLSPIPSGQSRLSFLNAVPRGLVSTPQIDGQPLAASLDFGQISPAAVIAAGAHRFAFASGDTLLASLNSALAAQQNYTLVLTGHTGGGSYRTLLLNTAIVAPSQVRAIHAAPDLGPIAVYLDAQPLATALNYRAGSDWQTVPARSYDIRVLTADADPQQADSLAETRFNLTSNQAVEILLLEDRGLPALRIFTTDLDPTEPLTARVVAINTAPDTPIAYAQAGDNLIDAIPPVAYGTASRTVDFPAGQINLYWVTGQGANVRVVEPVGDFNFEEGRVYTYVVTGSEYDPFVLVDDVGITQSPEQLATDGLPVATDDQTADLRVINAVTEPLELRVRLDGHTLVNGLENRQASAYQAVAQADYDLRVGPASNSANVPDYYIGTLSLLNRDRMSLVAYGAAESMQVSVLPDRVERVESSQALLRVIYAVPDGDQLYVQIDLPAPGTGTPAPTGTPESRPTLLPGRFGSYELGAIAPGGASEYIGLPVDTYDIRIARLVDGAVVAIVPRLALGGGTIYDLLLLPGRAPGEFSIELIATEQTTP